MSCHLRRRRRCGDRGSGHSSVTKKEGAEKIGIGEKEVTPKARQNRTVQEDFAVSGSKKRSAMIQRELVTTGARRATVMGKKNQKPQKNFSEGARRAGSIETVRGRAEEGDKHGSSAALEKRQLDQRPTDCDEIPA